MSITGSYTLITKRMVNLLIDFLRENVNKSKLYENTKVSNVFSMETAQIPCVIIRQTSNEVRRTHFDDFIDDNYSRVMMVKISGDNNIVGMNYERVNLPNYIEENNLFPWDTDTPNISGTDIANTLFTNISGNYNTTDQTTGIIITVPQPNNFEPQSIERIEEIKIFNEYTYMQNPTTVQEGIVDLAIAIDNEQFYMIYSGTTLSGINTLPIYAEQVLNDAPGLSGVSIKFNDVLYAGDRYQIRTYSGETFISERFGGIYDITISFDIYAMSTIEIHELSDLIQQFFVVKKFDLWDKAGFTIKTWTKSGESETQHLNEYIYKSSLNISGMVEWHEDRGILLLDSFTVSAIPYGSFYSGTYVPIGVSSIQKP